MVDDGLVRISKGDTDGLKDLAGKSELGQDLCAHPDGASPLHEMLIWLGSDTYVRPHLHRGKSESFHVVEGSLRVVLFGDSGTPIEVIDMGTYSSGKIFFYRLEMECYHTVIPEEPGVLIHEVTNGPFVQKDAEFADWAPDGKDAAAVDSFLGGLRVL